MSKKPVWVDEEAHVILKEYSKLAKVSMVDIASQLVLDRLRDLSPEAGLSIEKPAAAEMIGETAPAPAPVAPAPRPAPKPEIAVFTPTPMPPKPPRPPREKREIKDDGTVRYLGGIWLV